MAKSIIQAHTGKHDRECFLCRLEADRNGYYEELPHTGLHKHHFIHGTANKRIAEHYGLWAYVCAADIMNMVRKRLIQIRKWISS